MQSRHYQSRHYIAIFLIFSLAMPILFGVTLKPAPMNSADKAFDVIDKLDNKKFAFLSFDLAPNTQAENGPQSEVILEHLFRKRVPVILFSQLVFAEPFLRSIPEKVVKKLENEFPGEKWEYAKDWITVGYRPGGDVFLQALARSEKFSKDLGKDLFGRSVLDNPIFGKIKNLQDISFVFEVTGSMGAFAPYIQFFQTANYKPKLVHACTSITAPESYIYLDSGQLQGLLEGAAGAAWYSYKLSQENKTRKPDSALITNTALGIGHAVILILILIGNLSFLFERKAK